VVSSRNIGVNLAKNIGRARVRASGTEVTPSAQLKAVLGWAWNVIGFGVRLCLDSLEWGMEIVGYEKTEFSEICRWNLRDQWKNFNCPKY